ncbi:hypothetical protein BG011_004887 [Mortierella polycephala]|uniref:Uncharacterized protein n=1 Tax=Mortierella polycephala TaxID=41804 RepID=A0A9P6PYW8_9FUNG|nr:hypothetical protein BG011_004887 [Mortierella polycephala]
MITLACLFCLLSLFQHSIPRADAALAVRANATTTLNYRSWDPFRGEADEYLIPGVLLMGVVHRDCTVRVNASAAPAGQAIVAAMDPARPVAASIIVLRYDWLDYCATYDNIFEKLGSLNAQLQSLALPEVGAIIMHGDAQSNEDFGAPFTQLANAHHWNSNVRLNISYTGSDSVEALGDLLASNNHALLATVAREPGPWNQMWNSIGFTIVIRGLDVLAGLTFIYGLWVLNYIVRDSKETQNFRRYLILAPGSIYLPLSIAFAPYKVTVPWRNCVYYMSLLLPFISLGLQITMWSKLIYRIKRKKANKLFSYYSYVTIFVPVISSFLDGIGWLIPSVPMIRMIGERGFSFVTPAVILVQAILIFYFATTFFKSLQGVAISQTTRTALVKITVLNLAMISFFILMLLSRIVSLLGLNMRNRSAYTVELVVFRFSFIFFYAACFKTLSIRQPTGSTLDSKGTSGANNGSSNNKNASKNHTHYHMDDFSSGSNSNNFQRSQNDDSTSKPSLVFNKHLSNHASKGFTISDPNNISSTFSGNTAAFATPSYGGATPKSPKLTQAFTSQQQLLMTNQDTTEDYPDPYKFTNDTGHQLTHYTDGETASVSMRGDDAHESGNNFRLGTEGQVEDEEDNDSVYGSHRFQSSPRSKPAHVQHIASGGRVVSGKGRNSEGYARFDLSDEDRNAKAV